MSMFGAIRSAGSGMQVDRTWLDAISDNIANINTIRPTSGAAYQPRSVIAQAVPGDSGLDNGPGGGVAVGGVVFGDPAGQLVYMPDHPFADEQGMVRAPDIDLGDQMVQMIMAQRSFQSNVAVIQRAKEMYQQAMQIGR
ncbi:MAG: flagellar basal body rod protein FlgC [Acidimicrobiia bacterium]